MKLYATTTSDKHGREAKKGGDSFLHVKVTRGNAELGTLGVYEIENGGGYRIYWQAPADTFNREKGYTGIEIHNSDNDKRTA